MTRKNKVAVALALALLFYGTGVLVRRHFGVLVIVRNDSQQDLKGVSVLLEPQHLRTSDATLPPRTSKRFWISPTIESLLALEWVDGNGQKRSETVGGYLEGGYCGTIQVDVTATGVRNDEDVNVVFCLTSWWDFI